jgi:hypothetical protein
MYNDSSVPPPPSFRVSEDAGIENRKVATLELAVRRCNPGYIAYTSSYISSTLGYLHLIHHSAYISSTIRLHLIHNSATSHPHRLHLTTTRLHLIHHSAYISSTTRPTSHPSSGLHLIHHSAYISSTTRLHLIHHSAYISSTTRLHLIHSSATFYPRSATSHPQLDYILSTTRLHPIFSSAISLLPL